MRTSLAMLLLTATAVSVGGCVIPFPHIKQTSGPVEGVVVDGVTGEPLQGATVCVAYPDGGTREALTDTAGRFRFGSKHRFHWGYVFGVALNYSLPYDCGWHDFNYVVVEADGYRPVAFSPSSEPWPPGNTIEHYLHNSPASVRIQPQNSADDRSHPRSWHYPSIPLPPKTSIDCQVAP
jgi:hypothetical protein